MSRIALVVEGQGDVEAAPVLCHRILRDLIGTSDWFFNRQPVRRPRSTLVDERSPSPRRTAHPSGLEKALAIAHASAADAILLLCDADDDCPATFGPSCPTLFRRGDRTVPVRSVMACREFESWFLWTPSGNRKAHSNPERHPRGAKEALRNRDGAYSPRVDQVELARSLDLRYVWARSDSFDKLVRSLAELVDAPAPHRPPTDG